MNVDPLRRQEAIGYFWVVFLLGLTTIAAQIVLLREFLSFFYGNELILGLILANWMLLTGLGAYLGKNARRRIFSLSSVLPVMIVLAVLPFILVFLMYYLRNIVFVQGTMLNVLQVFVSSLVLLTPFCLLAGFVFTMLGELVSRFYQENRISKVYAWEAFGSLIGGIIFNLVLIWFLKTFQSLTLLAGINLLAIVYLTWQQGFRIARWLAVPLILCLAAFHIFSSPDRLARQFLYQGDQLEYYKSSPYGNIVVTRQGKQINYYENQVLLFSSQQTALNEETVHYPLLQHRGPEKVLLLSGGIPGVIEEILKYDIQQLDYVEINPWLLDAVRQRSDVYKDPRLGVINRDARMYVERTDKKYDAVLINLPEPSTAQLNRYYTQAFYRELKEQLNRDAVVSFSIAGAANYMSEEGRALNSSLYQTLHSVFENVLIVPGKKHYFIASDQPLTYDISRLVKERGFENVYVNPYYIQDDLLKRRGQLLMDELLKEAEINRDFRPITYYLKVRQWLSHFDFNYWLPLAVAAIMALYFFIRLHPVGLGMFAAGFAGASVEVVLLVAFQILYGYVYSMVGIIVTVFMAGLAAGTFYRERIIPRARLRDYRRVIWIMAGYILLLPLIIEGLHRSTAPASAIQVIFGTMMFITAALVGMVFSLSSQLRLKPWITVVSEIYSVDLLGAGIGTFIVSVYLIPLLGLMNVLIITAALPLAAGLMARLRLGR